MHRVKVELGARSYEILIGEGLLSATGEHCATVGLKGKCAIITEKNIPIHFVEAVVASLRSSGFDPQVLTLPAGEKTKSMKWVSWCLEKLARARLERKSFIVALGGGVVGDVAGFVAAIYLRGISFVQIPTTLSAQVDSSVGGKTGVNLRAGKNLAGAFHQPKLVICDPRTLATLKNPATGETISQISCGMAEVIKYGIIYDAEFFQWLELEMERAMELDPEVIAKIVARSCEIKAEVVSQDETETGLRAILNFGHTLGHALELVFKYQKYHGEAISVGQVWAAKLSQRRMGLPGEDVDRIAKLLKRAGLPTTIELSPIQKKKILQAMTRDKKVVDGQIKFVLAKRIGRVEYGVKVGKKEVIAVLDGN